MWKKELDAFIYTKPHGNNRIRCIELNIEKLLFTYPPSSMVLMHFQTVLTNCMKSKKISNDQELIQSDPTSCPQNQKGNN